MQWVGGERRKRRDGDEKEKKRKREKGKGWDPKSPDSEQTARQS